MAVTRRKLTVDEFRRAFETGVYSDDERLELLRGEVWVMAPIGMGHTATVIRLQRLFHEHFGRRALISTQNGLTLSRRDLPQPDLVLLRWRDDDYAGKNASAEDALLVVEVADSTLRRDRAVKRPLYAEAGVPELWIVNLPERVTEIHRTPVGGRYLDEEVWPFGSAFAPAAFPEVALAWLED